MGIFNAALGALWPLRKYVAAPSYSPWPPPPPPPQLAAAAAAGREVLDVAREGLRGWV